MFKRKSAIMVLRSKIEIKLTFSRKPSFLLWHLFLHPRSRIERHLHRIDMADSVSADNRWPRNIRRGESFLRLRFYRFGDSFRFLRLWSFHADFRVLVLFRGVEKAEISVRSCGIGNLLVEGLERKRKGSGEETLL